MGSCCSGDELSDANKDIGKVMKSDAALESQVQKLLLLGTGASGKSTIFKNLRKNNGVDVFDERATEEAANTLRSSLVQFMMRLLLASTQFEEEGLDKYKGCVADMEDAKVAKPITVCPIRIHMIWGHIFV